jgi:hypothetical protein
MRILCVAALLTFVVPVTAQTPMLQPGLYSTVTTIEIGATKMPPETDEDCITADGLKDFARTVLDPDVMGDCKLSNYVGTPQKLSFNAACSNEGSRYSMAVEMTFTATTYTSLLASKDFEGSGLTVRSSGRRTAACGG